MRVVKGEAAGCDVVGCCAGDPTVIIVCELKLSFDLELTLQVVDRASVADEVWIAACSGKGQGPQGGQALPRSLPPARHQDVRRYRRGKVSVIASSVAPMPRTNPKRRLCLMCGCCRARYSDTVFVLSIA